VGQEPQTARERALLLLRATLLPGLHPTASQRLVWGIRGAIALGVLVLIASAVDKTLWDWLKLLAVPITVGAAVPVLNWLQKKRELEIASQQAQDAALQAYLDQRGQLLLDEDRPLRQSEEGSAVRTVARAQTLAVLRRLDGSRRGTVVQFLYESRLIDKDSSVVDLTGAVLARAILTDANLIGANLRGTHLARASLVEAKLSDADLSDAKLFGADLSRARLDGANLRGAVLMSKGHGTPLPRASLSLREFTLEGDGPKNADLSDAHLWDADLTNTYVSKEQLRSENPALTLIGATMPDGQKFKKYEDWLKSKGSGEDVENSGPSQRL
jgi:uncharacterized protein YjbI with pentapeptide repeats